MSAGCCDQRLWKNKWLLDLLMPTTQNIVRGPRHKRDYTPCTELETKKQTGDTVYDETSTPAAANLPASFPERCSACVASLPPMCSPPMNTLGTVRWPDNEANAS